MSKMRTFSNKIVGCGSLGLGASVVWKDASQQRHERDNLSAGQHDFLSLMRWLWN